MTTEVIKVETDSTLREAVGKMLRNGVGSVVVVDDDTPTGIITEKDALSAAYSTGASLEEIDVSDVARRTPVTTNPSQTVMGAMNEMIENNVKKLPVIEELELVGIVTISDISEQISEIRKEAVRLSEEPTEED